MRILTILIVAIAALGGAAAFQFSGEASAQERARAVEQSAPARAVEQSAEGRIHPRFQRALESADTRTLLAMVQLSGASAAAGGLDVTTGGQGYICNGGNCACAGAYDCLAMFDAGACEEGTLMCNEYGCACKGSAGAQGTD